MKRIFDFWNIVKGETIFIMVEHFGKWNTFLESEFIMKFSSYSDIFSPATCQKNKICRHKLTYIEWWPVPSHPNPVIFIKIHSSWYRREHEGSVRIRRRQKNHYFIDYRSISVNKLGWMVASSGIGLLCNFMSQFVIFTSATGCDVCIDRDKFHNLAL